MSAKPRKRRSNALPIVLTVLLSIVVLLLLGAAVILGLIRRGLQELYGNTPIVESSLVTDDTTEAQLNDSQTAETAYILDSSEIPSEEPVPLTEAPVPEDASWEISEDMINYYDEMLTRFCENSSDPNGVMYDLVDLDNDNIPELFISEGEYHLARVSIFSYFDGQGFQLDGSYGSYGVLLYDEDTGLLTDTDITQGYYYRSDYHYAHGTLTSEFYCFDNEAAVENESEKQYCLNGDIVTADEYYAALNLRTLDDTVQLGRVFSPYESYDE